ncbi:hypothetical protein G9A89_019141 [Geosiphon pyriformis]|nr:hypothetical protein G9A89_019141 [Geosiphon pyriformis]
MPTVFQPSPGCQLPVTPPSQDQVDNIVMGEGSGEAIHNKTAMLVDLFVFPQFDGVHVFSSGLSSGYVGAGVTIVVNSSLAKHVCKISEVPGHLLCIRLLFRNKLSVSVLGLYAGALSVVQFSQADEINSLIAKAVNESSFVILGGDFNKDGSYRCVSFKKCFELGLVNLLYESSFVKTLTWCNFRGVNKTINYVFVSSNLVGVVVDYCVAGVEAFFNTDHRAVSISIGLDGLLDVQLNSICKQANKDHSKYDIKNVNKSKWSEFREATAANADMFSDVFVVAKWYSNLDVMWDIVHKVLVLSAGRTFRKKWFKCFDSVFNKKSSRFHKLELLMSKLVKVSLVSGRDFASLLDTWDKLDSVHAFLVKFLFFAGSGFDAVCSELAKTRKFYRSAKLMESKHAEDFCIRQAIEKKMESFEVDKGHTIWSVLERPFQKVVLDHLIMGEELVLEPMLVKSKPLNHVFDGVFTNVMCLISFDEMFGVISNLPEGKMAGLFSISNEFWKHCDKSVLDMLLVFLNFCLISEAVPGSWREAWVSMIPKSYEWEGVLTNTCPIALIETARKILSKILSDQISLAYSTFDVLCRDNFSVLKSTTTQSPIFAIGSVIKNALEKNRELWLVLQDM